MKFFGWMQNKFNGKQANDKATTAPPTRHAKQESREEFIDWPDGLLAIGTFGNNEAKQNQEIQDGSDDLRGFTAEEIGKLQKKELTKLLSKKPTSEKEKDIANLPLDRFLNCPSSLEINRRMSNALTSEAVDEKEEDDIERTITIILNRCKDICESKKKSIGRESVTFLLKKMFACRAGFAPQPSLGDTFQESRMEKLLRTLLYKKINPRNTSRASSMKRYIGDKQTSNKEETKEEEKLLETIDGSKWVKTDSEYIVLEI